MRIKNLNCDSRFKDESTISYNILRDSPIGRTVSIGPSCSKNRVHMNLWQTDFQGPFRKRKGTSNAAIQLMSTKSGNVVRNLDDEFNVLHLKSIHKGEHT